MNRYSNMLHSCLLFLYLVSNGCHGLLIQDYGMHEKKTNDLGLLPEDYLSQNHILSVDTNEEMLDVPKEVPTMQAKDILKNQQRVTISAKHLVELPTTCYQVQFYNYDNLSVYLYRLLFFCLLNNQKQLYSQNINIITHNIQKYFHILASVRDRIIMIKKTKKELGYNGGTTVYFYDAYQRIVHGHTGGCHIKPFYNLVGYNGKKSFNICLQNINDDLKEMIDHFVILVGLIMDTHDLFGAKLVEFGPLGYYGNQLTPEKYEKIISKLNQRYLTLLNIDFCKLSPTWETLSTIADNNKPYSLTS